MNEKGESGLPFSRRKVRDTLMHVDHLNLLSMRRLSVLRGEIGVKISEWRDLTWLIVIF